MEETVLADRREAEAFSYQSCKYQTQIVTRGKGSISQSCMLLNILRVYLMREGRQCLWLTMAYK